MIKFVNDSLSFPLSENSFILSVQYSKIQGCLQGQFLVFSFSSKREWQEPIALKIYFIETGINLT